MGNQSGPNSMLLRLFVNIFVFLSCAIPTGMQNHNFCSLVGKSFFPFIFIFFHYLGLQMVVLNGSLSLLEQSRIGQEQIIFFKTVWTTKFVFDKIWDIAALNIRSLFMFLPIL